MPTNSTTHDGRRGRALFAAASCVLFVVAALVWRALALPAIVMDGISFVEILSRAQGGLPRWYHAGYLPLGSVVEWFVGVGNSVDALLWVSALTAAGALVLLAFALRVEIGPRAAAIGVLVFIGAPGLWLMATNIEVHAAQAFGGALVLLAAVTSTHRHLVVAAPALVLAFFVAGTLHNSNVMLAGGAVWIAARTSREGWRFHWPRALVVAAAVAVGAGGALLANKLVQLTPEGGTGVTIAHLVRHFARPSSFEFVRVELLAPWASVLVFVLLFRPRTADAWRAFAPYVAAALPPVVVFVVLGIPTDGGYFVSAMLFATVGVLVADRVNERGGSSARKHSLPRARIAVLVAVTVIGIVLGVGDAQSSSRRELTAISTNRLALARLALPEGGTFMSIDAALQTICGRDPKIDEIDISLPARLVFSYHYEAEFAAQSLEPLLRASAQDGDTLAFNMSWRLLAEALPDLAAYHEAVMEVVELHYVWEEEEVDVAGFPFWIGRPR